MGRYRGVDAEEGWIQRRFAAIEQTIRENAAARRPSSRRYVHYLPNTVVNTTAKVSAIGNGNGLGSRTYPAGFWTPGQREVMNLSGTYQTPGLGADPVNVRVELGGVTMAHVRIAAGILAAGSTTRSLYGHARVTCVAVSGGIARLVCTGEVSFNTGTTDMTFSLNTPASVAAGTATGSAGFPGPLATVDWLVANAGLLDVTEQWENAQATQGTVITGGCITSAA